MRRGEGFCFLGPEVRRVVASLDRLDGEVRGAFECCSGVDGWVDGLGFSHGLGQVEREA